MRSAAPFVAMVLVLTIGAASVYAQQKLPKSLIIDSHMHVWSDDPVKFSSSKLPPEGAS